MSLCGLGISCEPAPCPHGKDSRREQCHLCDIHKQIASLIVQVAAQHEFKLNQINANVKLDKKVDEVVSQLKAWDEDLEYLDSMKLPKRIEKLEKQIANWEEKFYFLKDKLRSADEKPHKCPVCNGEGKLIINNGQLLTSYPAQYPTKECHACEGKGIIWG